MSVFNQYPYINVNDLNLDWIIKHFKDFIDEISKLEAWKSTHEKQYAELLKLVNDLNSGNWTPQFVATLVSWYKENIVDIIGEMVKQVFFGITDDGYFVAYIPESWNDIKFGTTGLDDYIAGVDYGHLTLSY